SGTGSGDAARQQVKNRIQASELREMIKPWLIVAANGEGLMPEARIPVVPKGKWDPEKEKPLHHKNGRPQGAYVAEPETPLHHKNGQPQGRYVAEKEKPLQK
ncbi:MAG TPA: hypothetical protein VK927_11435, partial [Adhaeribacter sp.]|nr:hypothetical protein [Adhaeribacter sp.]